MFYKLALKNVTKSIRDYTIYFLTLTFGVCLFYMFNSIDSQAAMMQLSTSKYESMQMLTQAISYVSVFISVILGFLIVYANQFLIKRRKKELGVYMTLGMEKGKISRILICETFFIGIFALFAGLFIGVFAAQGFSVVTAKMFEANLKAFQFTFSVNAFYKTLIYFGIIFLIVMLFNTVSISKLKLIDLLTAGKKNESLKIKRLWVSVAIFIVSVGCLALAYYFINKNRMIGIDNDFTAAIVLGSVGTLLFFLSLSGFLLRVTQTSRRLYFKNLNMFILRQINSKINTTFVSMSVICIMLLVTIGTLSTGMGLAKVLSNTVKNSTPYDLSFFYWPGDDSKGKITDLVQKLQSDHVDLNRYAADYTQLNYYASDVKLKAFHIDDSVIEQFTGKDHVRALQEQMVSVIPLSAYNRLAQMQGKPALTLKADEFFITCTMDQFKAPIESFLQSDGKIRFGGRLLKASGSGVVATNLLTSMSSQDSGSLVVPDALVDGLQVDQEVLDVNYKTGANEQELVNRLETVYNKHKTNKGMIMYMTRQKILAQSAGISTMASYLAIYIGLVFLITSAAVLALQQLSEASNNAERYGLLRKLGAEEKMIDHALLSQIAIYFFIPLSLAIVHSFVGIRVANNVVAILGHVDIAANTLITAVIFLVIYGGYFLATYLGSKSILRQRQN
ncbi:MAG TPA: ABC transporter permease [Caproiciproducens sp.]|nr:ABC transporter permease [Caproiciproducens sp.]